MLKLITLKIAPDRLFSLSLKTRADFFTRFFQRFIRFFAHYHSSILRGTYYAGYFPAERGMYSKGIKSSPE
jgi:hypothetical protein